ncbi:MAG TPA: ribosome rescue protein RqcH [Candidatus Krumholzibacteriaceae bacterium]|nr:ribosome rescue protein RqcH [Candidatus Krumholzibacteriaceae bacterium]
MKKEATSFDVAVVVAELKQSIKDAWITNIYQTDYKTLIFKLHKPDQPALNLLIKAGNRLHLTNFAIEKPSKPSGFCMTLRKFLRNGKIQTIEQHEFERIVTLQIRAKQEEFLLVCELFGDGNIILVNAQNKILQALSYRKMRDRNILRNETFQYPPPSGKNPFKMERKDLDEIITFGQTEIVKALARFLGVGGLYAEEILLRAKIDKNTPCKALGTEELDRVFNVLGQMLSKIEKNETEPVIVVDEKGEWIDVVPFRLEEYAVFQTKSYPSFSQALDDYYAEKGVEQKVTTATTEIDQVLAQQQRILSKQQKTLEELEQEIKKNKEIGNAIYAHFGELQLLMQEILKTKNIGKQWNDIAELLEEAKKKGKPPATFYNSIDPKNSILHLAVDQWAFSVNLRKSIQENAAEYYEKSKKAEKRLEGAKKAFEETKQKIVELEKQKTEKLAEVSKPIVKEVERRKLWHEKFRWFHSSEGFLVLGGKDAMQNEILIKKHTEPHDLVFHADIAGAPFVIIKTEGRVPSDQTVKEAAEFAAAFSRAWKEMFSAVDVYWVYPEQVSKTPPTGQFLVKGSFMIYGKKNYLRQIQLRTAIGVMIKDETISVIGGPKNAVANQTSLYVEIAPGERPSGTIAKQVRELLAQKSPKQWQERVLVLSLEEIQNFIPSGKGVVLP